MKKAIVTLFVACAVSLNAYAETLQYKAVDDFESLTEGAAPYYVDTTRDALAISASNPAYRNVFARASTTFKGSPGSYNVTISALGEIDGDCEYRLLVNGSLIGTAANEPAAEDYEIQQHTFASVDIPANAVIAVESNALTNGLVPEGDGTAFARGRWRTLTLESIDTQESDPLDLALSTSVSLPAPAINQEFVLRIEVHNTSTDQTATAPVVTIPVPTNTVFSSHALCTTNNSTVRCELPEINAGDTSVITIAAVATTQGRHNFQATISADQTDNNAANNSATTQVDAVSSDVQTNQVDLALSVSSNTATVTDGEAVEVQLTVVNQHADNTATAPIAAATLPTGLRFSGSADCAASGQSVSCELPELAPNSSTSASFSVQATQTGDAQIIATASANEAEVSATDNEVLYSVEVTAKRVTAETNTPATGNGNGNGNGNSTNSGAMDFRFLLLLIVASLITAYRRRQQL